MSKFNKLSLVAKFTFLVLFFIATFLLYGIYSIYQNSEMLQVTNTIYNHPLEVSNASKNASLNVIKMHRSMKDVVLAENDIQLAEAVSRVDEYEEIVFEELETIDLLILGEQGKQLQSAAFDLFVEWRAIRADVIELVIEGEVEEASEITKGVGADHVLKLESAFDELNKYAINKADTFILDARSIAAETEDGLIMFLVVGVLTVTGITFAVSRNIIYKIRTLTKGMDLAAENGVYDELTLDASVEITQIKNSYNTLIKKIISQLWLKDQVKAFVDTIDYNLNLKESVAKLTEIISITVDAENTLLYLFKDDELHFESGFAVSESRLKKKSFKMGEGLVGQAALSGRPFRVDFDSDRILENSTEILVFKENIVIPINYEKEIIGVLEVNSLKPLKEEQIDYLYDVSGELGQFVVILRQNDRVQRLLQEAQEANELVHKRSEELRSSNNLLLAKQVELEEQQSEILQSIAVQESLNEELEERTNEMQNQARELSIKNEELEAIQKQLMENNKQLVDSNKYKSDFLANMSHELRTPLNSIILLSTILNKNESESLADSDIKKVGIINKAGKELLNLINDILDLSKIESGKVEVRNAVIDVESMINDFEDMFGDLAKKKGISFVISNHIDDAFISDADKLSHIIINLLSNAFKFTKKGSIHVNLSQVDDQVEISVQDTGIGIAPEKQELIFQEFIQADGSISRKYGGTGLGLAICRNLADILGGTLTLESKVGEGSTFILTMPLAIEESMVIDRVYFNVKNPKGTILLIEDEEEYSTEMIKVLNRKKYSVIHSQTGEGVFELIDSEKIDGIILDLVLPEISGEEILHNLKQNSNSVHIPVHILTKKNLSKSSFIDEFTSLSVKSNAEEDAQNVIGRMEEELNKQYKILIVEDNEAEQTVLTELLEKFNYLIKIVESVEDAKSELEENKYDTAIVDYKLKDGTGIEVCNHIKKTNLDMSVIMFTAMELSKKEENKLLKMSDSIVLKTVNSRGRLLEELKRLTNKRRRVETNVVGLDLKGKNILICDDDVKNIYAISAALEASGVEIYEAFNGMEALDVLKHKKIDLVLMDIMMPVMDGVEAMTKIRENKDWDSIPVIAVTAKAMKGDRARFLEMGASDYLSKPIDYDILLRLIRVWLR